MESPKLTIRRSNDAAAQRLAGSGLHPLLARLWAARGITQADDVRLDAIQAGKRMLIVADYDCDGATACAVGIRALRAMGAIVDFLVPNRFETGYGLSEAVVDLALVHKAGRPDLLITVDNGIASVEGVAAAAVTPLDGPAGAVAVDVSVGSGAYRFTVWATSPAHGGRARRAEVAKRHG